GERIARGRREQAQRARHVVGVLCLGVEDAALVVVDAEAQRGGVDGAGGGQVGSRGGLPFDDRAGVPQPAAAAPGGADRRADAALVRHARRGRGERQRLQESVDVAVPDRLLVERREAGQEDAVRDLGLHRGDGGGGEGAGRLPHVLEDRRQGVDQLLLVL